MNILIVSCESWRETNNGGNVLSNIFSSLSDANIAQVYCSGETPENSICQKYFQISDAMLLSSEKGHKLEERDYSVDIDNQADVIDNKIKSRVPEILREPALLAREMLWSVSNWKTKELRNFVLDFKPDIIFAPCYSYYHVSKVALYVKSIAGCPMISYISDDNYSLKQFRFSVSFWINRLITRKWIRRHFRESSLVYTMTKAQKDEYEKLFGVPMKVLCKSADFSNTKSEVNNPIKLVYGGGLYLNRWKVLNKLREALDSVNTDTVKAQLHIYTSSKLSRRQAKLLNNEKSSFLHNAISFSELQKKYSQSDVAVHVESFDLKNRRITRLSFSTKIIDCMNSGCAILAIGPQSQAGIEYLKENDAAICVNDLKQMRNTVEMLVKKPSIIKEYAEKAEILGRKNHDKIQIEKGIRQDFCDLIEKND